MREKGKEDKVVGCIENNHCTQKVSEVHWQMDNFPFHLPFVPR
jgi:hypothetical protein